jgi:HemY protein
MKWFRLLLLWLGLSLIGALLFEVLASEPGRVIVSAGGKIYSMRLVVFVALWLLLWFVLWAVGWLISWPLRRFRKQALRAGRIRLANGLQALREGRFARAEVLLEKASEVKFQREAALHAAREAALVQQNLPKAALYLEQIREINPDDANLHEAEQAYSLQRYAEVLQLLPLNLSSKQSNPRALEMQCRSLSKLDKPLQAYDHLQANQQKIGMEGPQLWVLEKELAQQLIKQCPTDAVLMHWNAFSMPVREDADVQTHYWQRRMQLGDSAAAYQELKQALSEQWRAGLLKFLLTEPLEQLSSHKSDIDAWLEKYPNESVLHLLLARCQLHAGQKELALLSAEHAVSMRNSYEAQLVLLEIHTQRVDAKSVQKIYQALAQQN